jgi:uncharacterized protein (DUF1684 family)
MLLPALFLLISACNRPEPAPSTQESAARAESASIEDEETWRADILSMREKKDQSFKTSKTSPMAGVQYLRSDSSDLLYLTKDGRTFGLTSEPATNTVVSFVKKDDVWSIDHLSDDVVGRKVDDEVLDGAPLVEPVIISIEDFTIRAYSQEGRLVFIVFDPERAEYKAFSHLIYFPPDPGFAVSARLVKRQENDRVKMLTSQNLEKVFYRYATIEFNLDGKRQELTAYKNALSGEGADRLFIPFKDQTTGRATYGAGRYLEIPQPDKQHFLLDFNRCFNPLCNYSPAYNCPISPRENHLEVAIEAGEKTYPMDHHEHD